MQATQYISIQQAAELFPYPPARSTLSRYINRGLDGVRLRVVRSAGRVFTTAAWISEFIELTSQRTEPQRPTVRRPRRARRIQGAVVNDAERRDAEAALHRS